MPTAAELLTRLYADFNARNTAAVLAHMAPSVEWPASTEGSDYITGPAAIGAYWARQWSTLNPHVDPLRFAQDEAGRTVVTVHQVVHDLNGNLVANQTLLHIYTFDRSGLVSRMDIEASPA